MSLGVIAALIAAIAVAVLVMVLIPAILSIKKTAQSVSALADLLTNELKPTIKELNEVLVELKTVGGGVAEHTDDVRRFMSALGESGTQISTINRSVGVVTGLLSQAGAVATGVKVAGTYLLESYLKRKMKGV
ncbi:DUF948 domain-containing protein [Trichlorobacter lovleyi]|uniref:DUF948 domain-containing protein n=1 Tax=Trichlorobacter lovleyi TaxID=313985 RepID=UPI00223FE486|nr:DUF948 domain-containing protein [Trichlorobacter lovleyi]QOX77932.1 DUF948 domain-containing protein [Trichlorobacter lovleyi]